MERKQRLGQYVKREWGKVLGLKKYWEFIEMVGDYLHNQEVRKER